MKVTFVTEAGILYDLSSSKELLDAMLKALPVSELATDSGFEYAGYQIKLSKGIEVVKAESEQFKERLHEQQLIDALVKTCVKPYQWKGKKLPKNWKPELSNSDIGRMIHFVATGDYKLLRLEQNHGFSLGTDQNEENDNKNSETDSK